MIRTRVARVSFLLAALAFGLTSIVLISRCTAPMSGGSETGDARITGIVYNADTTPAQNATVHIRRKHLLADTSGALAKTLPDSLTVTTDRNGRYAITTIDTGTYVVEASDGGNNFALADSVPIASADVHDTVQPCYLKPAGSIKGTILLSEGGDPRKVFVLAFGIDRFARVDSFGRFDFGKLAEGKYDLELISSLDNYGVFDTNKVRVWAGDTTRLGTIVLPFTGIPTPTNIEATYDPLTGVVVVRWNKVAFNALQGYLVYRNDTASTIPNLISGASAIVDTFFNDTIFHNLLDTSSFVYVYRVKVQDRNANVSLNYSLPVTVTAASPTMVRTLITMKTLMTINDTARISDSVRIIADYHNRTRTNVKLSWFVGSRDSLVKLKNIAAKAGSDTLIWSWPTVGPKKVFVQLVDSTGSAWEDSITATMILYLPVLSEGFENGISDYRQVTYAPKQGLMSVSTNYAHSGTHSLTSDSNNTGIKRVIDPSIDDSIAGLQFYLVATKATHTNFIVAIGKPGSSANGLFTIIGMGIDKSDSLNYVYENAPDDPINEHKNFAALILNKWYKCKIEYDYSDTTLTYFLDDAIVYTRTAPSPMILQTFVVMRDSLGAQGPSGCYVDDVTIYKR